MSETPVSPTQQRKFEQFQKLPSADDAMAACRAVISAAELRPEELGTHWGVTVCAAPECHLRLNVGNRVLFEATANGRYQVFLLHSGRVPIRWRLFGRVTDGFPQVENSMYLLAGREQSVRSFLGSNGVPEKVAAHGRASWRTLPKADWHNPLVTRLLFP